MNDTQPVLVTGVAGLIGARVAHRLLEAGWRVIGIDNLNDYYHVGLKHHRLRDLSSFSGFEFTTLDIEHREGLSELFQRHRFAAVLNLAARAGVRYSVENPFVYFTTNVLGGLNLLDLAREHNVGKYVLASTSSLYAGQPTPFDESLPVNEPISPYAASKKSAEVTAFTYHHLHGIDVSILRYFTVYGPAGRPDMAVLRFIHGIAEGHPISVYGDGMSRRDFTFVDDIAAGTVAAMQPLGYQIINLGGGNNPISIQELISSIEQLLGRTARVVYRPTNSADMTITWAKIDKAKQLLGWQPQVSLRDGLRRTVDWYQENVELVREVFAR